MRNNQVDQGRKGTGAKPGTKATHGTVTAPPPPMGDGWMPNDKGK